MTFSQAFQAMKGIALQNQDSALLEIQAWHHHNIEDSLRWSAYSATKNQHYYGDSAEEAVTGYRRAWRPVSVRNEDTQAALDEAGSPSL